jgi:hypothetical protein
MEFNNNSWRGHMTAKGALKLAYITKEEFVAWRKEAKVRAKMEGHLE